MSRQGCVCCLQWPCRSPQQCEFRVTAAWIPFPKTVGDSPGHLPKSQPTQLPSFQSCSSTRQMPKAQFSYLAWSVTCMASRTSMGAGGQDTEGSCTTGTAGREQGKRRASQEALTHICLGKWTELIASAEDAIGRGKKNPPPYEELLLCFFYVS